MQLKIVKFQINALANLQLTKSTYYSRIKSKINKIIKMDEYPLIVITSL